MIIAVVQFPLPAPLSIEAATESFLGSAPKFQSVPGLTRKHFLRSPDGDVAGGVYLWESRAAADALYTDEWSDRMAEKYGTAPTVEFFDSPVAVDADAVTQTP